LENGSCTAWKSPRSSIIRKNAVDLQRGALHSARILGDRPLVMRYLVIIRPGWGPSLWSA
jgi:hypothetical protein